MGFVDNRQDNENEDEEGFSYITGSDPLDLHARCYQIWTQQPFQHHGPDRHDISYSPSNHHVV